MFFRLRERGVEWFKKHGSAPWRYGSWHTMYLHHTVTDADAWWMGNEKYGGDRPLYTAREYVADSQEWATIDNLTCDRHRERS